MEFKDLLESVLRDHDGDPQLRLSSVRETPCAGAGQNFMSVVSLVRVDGELADGTPYNKSVFVKRATSAGSLRVDDAFANEVLMYRTVLPLITTAADVTGVLCPTLYHAASDVILLEDLTALGYGVGEVPGALDLPTARGVVETLATFHALSFHTSVVDKDRFFETIKPLKPLGLTASSNKGEIENGLKRTIRFLEAENGLEKVVTYLKTFQGSLTDKMRKLKTAKHVAVLIHGDFWFNNILIHKEGSGVPKENRFRIIDLQACALQSPAVDFWLFMYTSISPTILMSDCDRFVSLYCRKFISALYNQKTDPEQIPSLESLIEEITSKELYGFLAAMAYLPALYIKQESVEKIKNCSEEERMDEEFFNRVVSPEYRKRLIQLARYCSKKGIL